MNAAARKGIRRVAPPAKRSGRLWLLGAGEERGNRFHFGLRDAFPESKRRPPVSRLRRKSSERLAQFADDGREGAARLADARTIAYAIYVLRREGVVTTNYILNLRDYLEKNFAKEWPHDLTGVYLAGALRRC